MGKHTFIETIAKRGNCFRDPNKGIDSKKTESEGGPYWPIHSPTYREHLELSTTNITMGKGLRNK